MTQHTLSPTSTGGYVPASNDAGILKHLWWNLADTYVVIRRNLLYYVRQPQLLIFSTIQPIMFLVLFTYVFGGAISFSTGDSNYINFLLPGIIIQSSIFAASQTTVGLSVDLSRGMIDRFRSLPMSTRRRARRTYHRRYDSRFIYAYDHDHRRHSDRLSDWRLAQLPRRSGFGNWFRFLLHLDFSHHRSLCQRSRSCAGGWFHLDFPLDIRQFDFCADPDHARLAAYLCRKPAGQRHCQHGPRPDDRHGQPR